MRKALITEQVIFRFVLKRNLIILIVLGKGNKILNYFQMKRNLLYFLEYFPAYLINTAIFDTFSNNFFTEYLKILIYCDLP